MKTIFSAIGLALAISSPISLAQDGAKKAEPVLLKAKLMAGKTYKYQQSMEMKMQLPLGGAGESTTKMLMDLNLKVAKAPDGDNKLVTAKFDRVKMQMNMAGQDMVFDSTDPKKQNPLLKAAFADIGDKEFEAIYDKNDQFVKMKGGGGAAAAPMGMGINDAQIEQMLRQISDYGFPTEPIAPGHKWKHIQNTDMGQMGGKMAVEMNFTYKGQVERDGKNLAEIEFSGDVGAGAGAGAGAAQVTFKDSTMSGKMYFDTEIGSIQHTDMLMDMTMAIGGEAGAEMDTKTKSTYKLLSVE